ncbi:CLUMA_CG010646, isoform A [Clunio marinus]|uniref:CLUMA_CG010646, isoform A n=1 Tax=Clunio marinus TaxID=568069 RepID=A0A1J1IBX5_9DIPT|nr:CLUMA_CG010646, isoform A [Clunio marinus]
MLSSEDCDILVSDALKQTCSNGLQAMEIQPEFILLLIPLLALFISFLYCMFVQKFDHLDIRIGHRKG